MSDLDLRAELLAAFESEYREHLHAIRAVLASGPVADAALRDVFRRAHSLKGAARAVDLPRVEAIAHELETLLYQSVEQAEPLSAEAVGTVHRGLDAIEARMREPEPPLAQELPPPTEPLSVDRAAESAAEIVLRVAGTEIDRLAEAVHALSDATAQQEQARRGLAEAALEARQLVLLWDASSAAGSVPGQNQHQNQSQSDFEQRLRRLSHRLSTKLLTRSAMDFRLDQAVRSVQEQVEQIVLVAADAIFAPLGGMARDLARELGGEADIAFVGLELRAERRILQALRDPAIQLLRNAVSHGMRHRDTPLSITLSLRLRAGRLELSVADDGPGPDLARIEQIARTRGLLPDGGQGAMPPVDERRLLSLVFEPGFSTATEINRLSGRGMGLSIVAEAAYRLHGDATLRRGDAHGAAGAGAGAGAVVVVSVPLPARRQTLLLVEAADQLFGLPSAAVERLLHVPMAAVEWPDGRPLTRLRGGEVAGGGADIVLRLASLAMLVGGPDLPAGCDAGPMPEATAAVVVLATGPRGSGAGSGPGSGRTASGLVVDRLHDVRTLLVRAPDVVGIDRRLVAGIALVEQDRPVLVLAPDTLIETLFSIAPRVASGAPRIAAGAPEQRVEAPARSQATILVVDDSITTRTLEKTILQAQGYRVLIAVDGMEALTVLRTAQWEIDVVIADVEMPRLDGFGLLAAMQADARLRTIPTVLMTSRNQALDVRRGLELGARAYIAKQDFDQGALLSTIARLLP